MFNKEYTRNSYKIKSSLLLFGCRKLKVNGISYRQGEDWLKNNVRLQKARHPYISISFSDSENLARAVNYDELHSDGLMAFDFAQTLIRLFLKKSKSSENIV
jgi:hypothetical protein